MTNGDAAVVLRRFKYQKYPMMNILLALAWRKV